MSEKQKITAFHGIFEQRLTAIVKRIKKIRKHPEQKEQVRKLLIEAKDLKKTLKKSKKPQYRIEIPIRIENSEVVLAETSASSSIKILDTRLVGGLLIVDFQNQEITNDSGHH